MSKKLDCDVIDCFVIGFGITKKDSFEYTKGDLYHMYKDDNLCSNLIYLIANKIDLYLYTQKEVDMEEAIEFAEKENLRFFGISIKTGEGINEFLDDLILNLIYNKC